MISEKLLEVLSHKADGAVTIVSQGEAGPHVVNTWNSYVGTMEDNKLLIPAGGFRRTEENILKSDKVQLSICSREVQGLSYKGTGFIVKGSGRFIKSGSVFDSMKEKFPWMRAVFEVTVESAKQTQ